MAMGETSAEVTIIRKGEEYILNIHDRLSGKSSKGPFRDIEAARREAVKLFLEGRVWHLYDRIAEQDAFDHQRDHPDGVIAGWPVGNELPDAKD